MRHQSARAYKGLYVQNNGLRFHDKQDGLSFGAGFDIKVTEQTSLNLEYVRYINNAEVMNVDYDVDAIGVGVTFKF